MDILARMSFRSQQLMLNGKRSVSWIIYLQQFFVSAMAKKIMTLSV